MLLTPHCISYLLPSANFSHYIHCCLMFPPKMIKLDAQSPDNTRNIHVAHTANNEEKTPVASFAGEKT